MIVETVYEDGVVKTCLKVKELIDDEGCIFRNTNEALGVTIDLNADTMDLSTERELVKQYYGDRFEARLAQEINHYNQLKYSLLHKLEEIEFFFHEGPENRKAVISSNDCISCIQYIRREDYAFLMVHMRSSDVVDLLPLDLLYLLEILITLNGVKSEQPIHYTNLYVTIGSAHYYTENSPRS